MDKVNIAIDGPAGAGKSTVSKEIAKRLNYTFINSGSVYRAIAYNALKQDVNLEDASAVEGTLSKGMIELKWDESVYLKGENVSLLIRSEEVSAGASLIAKYQSIRNFVVEYIQELTKSGKGFIMDGRDTTFKLMPHAEVKIFLWAEPEERAKRRWLENKERGFNIPFETVLKDVMSRDFQDMNREVDPLHKTEDAVLVDTTNYSFEEVVNNIIDIVKRKSNLRK